MKLRSLTSPLLLQLLWSPDTLLLSLRHLAAAGFFPGAHSVHSSPNFFYQLGGCGPPPSPFFPLPFSPGLQSDPEHQVLYSRNIARDCVQMPRLHYVKKRSVALNKIMKRMVGLKLLAA
jgi:hypothetical protein